MNDIKEFWEEAHLTNRIMHQIITNAKGTSVQVHKSIVKHKLINQNNVFHITKDYHK